MDEQHEQEHVGRRRLLRGAGAVVAGVAGAGVAGAVVATPAQAADGQPIVQGQANNGNTVTEVAISGGNAATSAPLKLRNPAGPALTLEPVSMLVPSTAAPAGSVYIDDFGDIWTVGDPDPDLPGGKFVNLIYSPTWAMMTVPINPVRLVDSRNAGQRAAVVGAQFDSAGRIVPRFLPDGQPDALINLSQLATFAYGVQFNLTVDKATKAGFISAWGFDKWPGTSSLNFTPTFALSNFVQSTVGFDPSRGIDSAFQIKLSQPAAVIVDVVGFIVGDPTTDLTLPGVTSARGAQARRGQVARRTERGKVISPTQ
jgi:hypothetical protein